MCDTICYGNIILSFSTEVNFVAAAANGASQSIALVANVAVNLIAFVSLLAFVDGALTWFGHRVGLCDPALTFRVSPFDVFRRGLQLSPYV